MNYLKNRLTLNSFLIATLFHIIAITFLLSTEKPNVIENFIPKAIASTSPTTQILLVNSSGKNQSLNKNINNSSIIHVATNPLSTSQLTPKKPEIKPEKPIQEDSNRYNIKNEMPTLPVTNNTPTLIEALAEYEEDESQTKRESKDQVVEHPEREDIVKEIQVDEDSKFNHPPVYPKLSKRLKEQGIVILRVKISELGSIEKVSIDESSGFSRLDNAAIKAILKWRFYAATHNGKPIQQESLIPIEFQLH